MPATRHVSSVGGEYGTVRAMTGDFQGDPMSTTLKPTSFIPTTEEWKETPDEVLLWQAE